MLLRAERTEVSIAGIGARPLILPISTGPSGAWQVQIGAVWHNAWKIENVLMKFCKPIFALTSDAQFPYCLMGSGAAVKLAGRHFRLLLSPSERDCDFVRARIRESAFEPRIMSASTARPIVFDRILSCRGCAHLADPIGPACRSWFSESVVHEARVGGGAGRSAQLGGRCAKAGDRDSTLGMPNTARLPRASGLFCVMGWIGRDPAGSSAHNSSGPTRSLPRGSVFA